MTMPDEVTRFLAQHTRTFLLTLRKDGSPTAHPMTGFFTDGRIVMNTYRASAKVRNVGRDARAACVIVNGYDADGDVRAVAMKGRAHVREAEIAQLPSPSRAASRVPGAIVVRVADRLMTGKRVLVEVEPDEVVFVAERSGK